MQAILEIAQDEFGVEGGIEVWKISMASEDEVSMYENARLMHHHP